MNNYKISNVSVKYHICTMLLNLAIYQTALPLFNKIAVKNWMLN
jgi:hypothetical protein